MRHIRPAPSKILPINGQNRSTKASVVIEPTSPFDQNTPHVSAGADHRQAKGVLRAVAEHERERERGERDANLFEYVADHAEASISQMSNIAFWIA